jgi:hypothetical protein
VIGAFYDFSWLNSLSSFTELFFAAHTTGIRWWYSETPGSLFDPANLGQPLVRVYAGGDARYQFFPTTGSFDFYLSPRRESLAYLKVGVPLIDFMGTISLPFQIYAGYSY